MTAKPFALVLVIFFLMPTLPLPTGEAATEAGVAEWTFIVYLDADNNLEGPGMEDLDEMEAGGSSENVNIIAIMDRASPEAAGDRDDKSDGDWQDLRIFRVQKDGDQPNGVLAEYTEGENVWFSEQEIEPNMGDPGTLANYTKWVIDRFPARHYLLDFWNHGGAFWGICWDDSSGENGDALNMTELEQGLEEITDHIGRKLDVIGFDACLMAQAAVLYQIKDYCDVAVASGFTEPGDGWPYEGIVPPLVEDPQMTPVEVGRLIVNAYIESYTDKEDDPDDSPSVSMAAFDMAKFENTAEAIGEFGMALSIGPDGLLPTTPSYYAQLAAIRSRTAGYDMVNVGPFDFTQYCMYDIIDFADRIEQDPMLDFLHGPAQRVKQASNEAIIRSKTNDAAFRYHGLTVYYPSGTQTVYDPRFDATRFAKEKYWDEFLHHFAQQEVVENTPPSVTITHPQGSQTIGQEAGTITVRGTAFDLQNTLVSVEIRVGEGEWQPVDGRESWSFVLPLQGMSGKTDIRVRAFDGEEHSPEVVRSFAVQEEGGGAQGHQTSGGGSAWVLLGIPLVALLAAVAIKKRWLSSS